MGTVVSVRPHFEISTNHHGTDDTQTLNLPQPPEDHGAGEGRRHGGIPHDVRFLAIGLPIPVLNLVASIIYFS